MYIKDGGQLADMVSTAGDLLVEVKQEVLGEHDDGLSRYWNQKTCLPADTSAETLGTVRSTAVAVV